jgi:hypothetical protein
MAVSAIVLIPSKNAETTQTTQYTSQNVTTIIDKFTAANYSTAATTISVNLVSPGGSAGASNLITVNKTLQAAETYTFPEIVGHVLAPGGFISTICGATLAVSIRASGRQIT